MKSVVETSLTTKQPLSHVLTGHVTVAAPEAGMSAATLTLEAGVILQFKGRVGLYVGEGDRAGALSAIGEEYQPVVFTSTVTGPDPSYWYGLFFGESTDDENTILRNCIIEYAERAQISNSSPTIEYSHIRKSSGTGISIGGWQSAPVIRHNQIAHNAQYGITADYKECDYWNDGCTVGRSDIHHNHFSDNGVAAIRVSAVTMDCVYENFGSGETTDYVEIESNRNVNRGSRWMRNDTSLPYVVESISLEGSEENPPSLVIDPGDVIKFQEQWSSINVGYRYCEWSCWEGFGILKAEGTPELPIIFTTFSETPAAGSASRSTASTAPGPASAATI